MDFIFHDMLNSYFSARETLAYFQSKYFRQAQPMLGPHPFSAGWRRRVLSVSMIKKKSAGVMEVMLQMQDYMGLQVLDRSLISIGCRKASCDDWLALSDVIYGYYPELLVEIYSPFQSRNL